MWQKEHWVNSEVRSDEAVRLPSWLLGTLLLKSLNYLLPKTFTTITERPQSSQSQPSSHPRQCRWGKPLGLTNKFICQLNTVLWMPCGEIWPRSALLEFLTHNVMRYNKIVILNQWILEIFVMQQFQPVPLLHNSELDVKLRTGCMLFSDLYCSLTLNSLLLVFLYICTNAMLL